MSAVDAPAVTALAVLYDASCGLCRWVREWLEHEPTHLPLHFVPCGSEEALRRWPTLDHAGTTREVTVVADTGEVWTADGAWLTVLWATRAYRPLSYRLSWYVARRGVRAVALSLAASRRGVPAPDPCHDGRCSLA